MVVAIVIALCTFATVYEGVLQLLASWATKNQPMEGSEQSETTPLIADSKPLPKASPENSKLIKKYFSKQVACEPSSLLPVLIAFTSQIYL